MLRLLILSLAVACVPSGKESLSTGGASGGNPDAPSRWPVGTFPKTLVISQDFSNAEETEIRRAASDWSADTGHGANFFTVPGANVADLSGTANLDDLMDGEYGIYKATSWHPDLPATALAVTQIFGVRKNRGDDDEYVKIVEADVLVNWTYDFAPTDPTGYDLYSVVLHELGHFLGLYHVYDYTQDSVMFPTIGFSTVYTEAGAHDILKLRSKYGLGMPASVYALQAALSLAPKEPVGTHAEANSKDGVRIRMELLSNGTCVHKIDGTHVGSHPVSLKR